jgi:hypothetical protein
MARAAHDVVDIVDKQRTAEDFEAKPHAPVVDRDLVRDIHTVWIERGIEALREVAAADPGKFCQLAVQVLPKDVKVDIDTTLHVAVGAAEAFAVLSKLDKRELLDLKANDEAD